MRLYRKLTPKEAASLLAGTSGMLSMDLSWGTIGVVKKSVISELEHLARNNVELYIDLEIRDDDSKVITHVAHRKEEDAQVYGESAEDLVGEDPA